MKSSYFQVSYHPYLEHLFLNRMILEIVFTPLFKVSPDILTSYANIVLLVGKNVEKFKINVLNNLVMVFLKMQHG